MDTVKVYNLTNDELNYSADLLRVSYIQSKKKKLNKHKMKNNFPIKIGLGNGKFDALSKLPTKIIEANAAIERHNQIHKDAKCCTCGSQMEIDEYLEYGECYDCRWDTGNFEEDSEE